MRAAASSRTAGDGPLDEAAGGLGGDAELLADLAEAALASPSMRPKRCSTA